MCKCSLLRATAADQVNNKRDVRYRHDGCKQRAATSESIVQILCEVRNLNFLLWSTVVFVIVWVEGSG